MKKSNLFILPLSLLLFGGCGNYNRSTDTSHNQITTEQTENTEFSENSTTNYTTVSNQTQHTTTTKLETSYNTTIPTTVVTEVTTSQEPIMTTTLETTSQNIYYPMDNAVSALSDDGNLLLECTDVPTQLSIGEILDITITVTNISNQNLSFTGYLPDSSNIIKADNDITSLLMEEPYNLAPNESIEYSYTFTATETGEYIYYANFEYIIDRKVNRLSIDPVKITIV